MAFAVIFVAVAVMVLEYVVEEYNGSMQSANAEAIHGTNA